MRFTMPRLVSAPGGTRRMFCVLLLAVVAILPANAALNITVTVAGADAGNWNAGSLGVGNIANPGDDFTPTITGANPTVTMVFRAGANNTNYYIRVRKAADEATTWNDGYQVWICPLGSSGTGTVTWLAPVAIGTWSQVTSTDLPLFRFRTTNRNQTKTITFRLELRNITVTEGTTASTPSYTTTLTYTANTVAP
jgi:hypothetical protein